MRSYVYEHRVTLDETNLVGNVYFAHYLHWQGHAREHFLADHAPGVLAALHGGLVLVTVDCSAEFYAEGEAFDIVEVRMTLSRVAGGRITMSFDYVRVAPEPSVLLARGRQTVACVRRTPDGPVPVPVPDELRDALDRYASAVPA